MSLTNEIIFVENGKLNFGDYILEEKSKKEDFSFNGDLYKVKTFKGITKLERNGLFAYESEPGSKVREFQTTINGLSFIVESYEDLQITLGVEEEKEYEVFIDGKEVGTIKTNISGKLVLSIEFEDKSSAKVEIIRK